MKAAVIYPPLLEGEKYPLLGQNRQFRYSSTDTVRIFPLVPASAATMVSKCYEILYLDGINRRLSMEDFMRSLCDYKPDIVMIETKVPVIRKHWNFINQLKKEIDVKVALVGDHVSFMPEESMLNSNVDYVLTGGDYDVLFLNVCQHIDSGVDLMNGIWYRNGQSIGNTGTFQLVDDLDSIPFIDRDLTDWETYGEAYLYRPVMYILSGRGCGRPFGPGVCTFCVWQHALWRRTARLRSPASVASEIQQVVERYGVVELFDDNESGAIWSKPWLEQFYLQMKARDLIGKVLISSNASADALDNATCELLEKIGYRLLKIGLESGNDETLKRLAKRETVDQISRGVKTAKDHGLRIHLTNMAGYPWETEEDEERSREIAKELVMYKTRFGDSLQASVMIPYPGTPMHRQGIKGNWLTVGQNDYEKYDMSQPVMKCSYDAMQRCDDLWAIHRDPRFLLRSALTLRSRKDLSLAWRGVKSLRGHTRDF
ncbi:MAG: radical SAM protein [Chloroflexota bacterium]|nr:radical SAM protein [Chloroflexota bacterium]